ncbi:hypothetical protein Bca52824_025286 [Brassica carinata]|uniref:Uncharacterized protein n=1 Tax=Brassica carinata TaxID=52824 RepID=A0A8X7VM30_BRACI|nr:hypothetical protein Bca52824_025286 [Brassica carinata]
MVVACRNKTCESPLEVISSQLVGSELVPSPLVKTLLYPGAIVKSLLRGSPLPTYHNLFYFYHFDQLHRASSTDDIRHLEVFAGCCLCLLGALLSIFKPRRLTFIGTLLIYWGLLRDILVFDSSSVVRVYPTLFLASLSAFLSIRSDPLRFCVEFEIYHGLKCEPEREKVETGQNLSMPHWTYVKELFETEDEDGSVMMFFVMLEQPSFRVEAVATSLIGQMGSGLWSQTSFVVTPRRDAGRHRSFLQYPWGERHSSRLPRFKPPQPSDPSKWINPFVMLPLEYPWGERHSPLPSLLEKIRT